MPSNSAVHALPSCILPLLLKWVIDLDFYIIGSWGFEENIGGSTISQAEITQI